MNDSRNGPQHVSPRNHAAEDPIGKQVSGGGMDNFWTADVPVFGTVVGVVGDVRHRNLIRAARPTVYWNYRPRRKLAPHHTRHACGSHELTAGGVKTGAASAIHRSEFHCDETYINSVSTSCLFLRVFFYTRS